MRNDHPSSIIFVCEHGAAKSVVAAAFFNKLASERNLNIRAIARGTNPDTELSPNAVTGLQADGLVASESIPQKLSLEEIKNTQRVIAFYELPKEYQNKPIEQWDGVPPVSEDYEKARDVIVERINRLLESK